MGPRAAEAVPALIELLQAQTPNIYRRNEIRWYSERFRRFPQLGVTFSGGGWSLEDLAIEALGKIGPQARDATEVLKTIWLRRRHGEEPAAVQASSDFRVNTSGA